MSCRPTLTFGELSTDLARPKPPLTGGGYMRPALSGSDMRDEEEIREQYEFLKRQLDDEDMRHEGVRQMFTYYKRALGWVLEEEHI